MISVVCGPAGIGKTSYVLNEIHKQGLDQKGNKVVILCSEYEQNHPAHSILQQAEVETKEDLDFKSFEVDHSAIVVEESHSRLLFLQYTPFLRFLRCRQSPVYIITQYDHTIPRYLPPFKLVMLGERRKHQRLCRADPQDYVWFPNYPKR